MKKRLVNLNPGEYEHPFDKKALASVKSIPLLPKLTESILNWTVVKQSIIALCGSNYHITRSACPDFMKLCSDVFSTLSLDSHPEIYSQQDYYINAYTTGHQHQAFIVVSTGAVDRLDDAELSFVIGHEAGHIKSGHVLYHLLTAYIGTAAQFVPGIGPMAVAPIALALKYWNRMSEFTADRAGLLACQDLDTALRAIMKMSGLPQKYYGSASVQGFMQQAQEFEHRYGDSTSQIYKLMEIIDEDHPWSIVRAAELIRWVKSGEYQRVIDEASGITCPTCGQAVAPSAAVCPTCGHKFD